MATELWWYVARSGGILAWVMLSASVIWGLLVSTRALGRRPRPAWLLDLHRFLGACAVVFSAIHVIAIVADSYVHFGISDVLVPFASSWHPVAVAWGIVSLYLLAAVEITSLLRRQLSRRAWHLVHLSSLPLFLTATFHGLSAGTDASGPVLRGSMVGVTLAVMALLVLRLVQALLPAPAEPAPSPVAEPVERRVPIGSVR
jgi:methionine sulfoxide reductase heme-binding subunit